MQIIFPTATHKSSGNQVSIYIGNKVVTLPPQNSKVLGTDPRSSHCLWVSHVPSMVLWISPHQQKNMPVGRMAVQNFESGNGVCLCDPLRLYRKVYIPAWCTLFQRKPLLQMTEGINKMLVSAGVYINIEIITHKYDTQLGWSRICFSQNSESSLINRTYNKMWSWYHNCTKVDFKYWF